jgi:LysM domain-containing protein
MSITHEEARRLIEFKADNALKGIDDNLLEAHLTSCLECQNYAANVLDLESTLQSLLQRRWNQYPLPLSTDGAVSRKNLKHTQNIFFATRIIAMGVICIAFLFNIWQFTQSGRQSTNPPSSEIPLIPTPSMQSTTTKVTDQQCEPILYQVRQKDTLESIANRFSVPTDKILSANHLKNATLATAMKLSIPVCNPTPPETPNTVTTTYTPLFGQTSLTPENSPTQ